VIHFFRVVMRNPSLITKHRRRARAVYRAMRAYRKTHRECAWCGRSKNLDCHHKEPISVRPDLAADPGNYIMLCHRWCHVAVGHNAVYTRHVEALPQLIAAARRVASVRYKKAA